MLVPALPAAGRITVDGVHLFLRDGVPTPLHETEYANDGGFAYASARLLDWAEERQRPVPGERRRRLARRAANLAGSGGIGRAVCASEIAAVPTAFAPDAETEGDLAVIAAGLAAAEAKGCDVIVRCAPAFAGVLAGTTARGPALLPGGKRVSSSAARTCRRRRGSWHGCGRLP